MLMPSRRCLGGMLLVCGLSLPLPAQLRDEAYVGEPFGVARITVPQTGPIDALPVLTNGCSLSERQGRALYPAFTSNGPVGLLRQMLGEEATAGSGPATVLFLFRGADPLELTVATPTVQTVRIRPQSRPRGHARLLRTWWRNYSAAAQQQTRQGDYPPLIETYLTTVLGQRLGLQPPLIGRLLNPDRRGGLGNQSLMLLLNVESMRLQALEESLSRSLPVPGPADQPVPEPIDWSTRKIPAADEQTQIEPIASRVPAECLYVRFGSFDNYLWLRELMEENGGDIGRMVTARGHDAALNERLQGQLGLKESALAKLLGGQVISDVAMIGRDTYLREGAAFGVLFEARNNVLLQNDLMKQRRDAVARMADAEAEMTSVEVAGQTVSLAASPDNRLRSFYAADGGYHLVATSQAMIARFLETGQGIRPLGATAEFRLARQTLPLDREDTVFVYLSPAFFRGLMSPQYQIELRRRMRAVSDLEVLQMARRVARLEGYGESFEELIRAGLVPRNINLRPDGSHPVQEHGQWVDSRRGARGTFLPIPDVELQAVTSVEAAQYQQTAAFHRAQWDHMDPLIVALKRFSLEEEGRERLRVEARMLPFDRQKYGRVTSIVGPPSQMQLRPVAQDIVSIQLVLQGGLLRPGVEPHLLFLGLRDANVPLDFGRSSLLRTLMILRSAPAYLGAWPQLGLLDLLPLGGRPDAQGYSQLPLGLWRRQTPDGFSVLSFDPAILETTVPQLGIERSDYQAQVRIRIGDISQRRSVPGLTRSTTRGHTKPPSATHVYCMPSRSNWVFRRTKPRTWLNPFWV